MSSITQFRTALDGLLTTLPKDKAPEAETLDGLVKELLRTTNGATGCGEVWENVCRGAMLEITVCGLFECFCFWRGAQSILDYQKREGLTLDNPDPRYYQEIMNGLDVILTLVERGTLVIQLSILLALPDFGYIQALAQRTYSIAP